MISENFSYKTDTDFEEEFDKSIALSIGKKITNIKNYIL